MIQCLFHHLGHDITLASILGSWHNTCITTWIMKQHLHHFLVMIAFASPSHHDTTVASWWGSDTSAMSWSGGDPGVVSWSRWCHAAAWETCHLQHHKNPITAPGRPPGHHSKHVTPDTCTVWAISYPQRGKFSLARALPRYHPGQLVIRWTHPAGGADELVVGKPCILSATRWRHNFSWDYYRGWNLSSCQFWVQGSCPFFSKRRLCGTL